MYVCMYVYIYIYIYVINVYIHNHPNTNPHTHTHTYTPSHTNKHIQMAPPESIESMPPESILPLDCLSAKLANVRAWQCVPPGEEILKKSAPLIHKAPVVGTFENVCLLRGEAARAVGIGARSRTVDCSRCRCWHSLVRIQCAAPVHRYTDDTQTFQNSARQNCAAPDACARSAQRSRRSDGPSCHDAQRQRSSSRHRAPAACGHLV